MDKLIGQRIKEKRKELKLTQVQIKKMCGISNGNLSDFENGNKAPSAGALIALSKVLHVSIDWILTGEDHFCDITKEILSPLEQEELELFRKLNQEDQEEILDMIQLKINRRAGKRKSSGSENEIIETA